MELLPDGRVKTHWMVEIENGPIKSGPWKPVHNWNRRFAIACKPTQNHFAGLHCSGETHTVTCEDCKKHPLYQERYEPAPNAVEDEIDTRVKELFEKPGVSAE